MGNQILKNLKSKFSPKTTLNQWPGLIKAYKKWLPINKKTEIINAFNGASDRS